MAKKHQNLHSAKKNKKDEFYTLLTDIEKELRHYKPYFKDKVILLNCDDPETSNFWKYFELNFDELGLKKLISTHYDPEKPTYKLEIYEDINGDGKMDKYDIVKTPLSQNGDFRSPESIELLKEADIVITNPPFSLLREFILQLAEYNKKFIFIGNQNAITYKEVFPLIQQNKLWLGYGFPGNVGFFESPYEDTATSSQHQEGRIRVSGVTWFTNFDLEKRHEQLILWKYYSPDEYPQYHNYNAIEVGKVVDIPNDYEESWGIPLDIDLDKINDNKELWHKLYNGKNKNGVEYQWIIPGKDNEQYNSFIEHTNEYANLITNSIKQTLNIEPIYRNGIIGVPITFFEKYSPDQFEILGLSSKQHHGIVERLHDNDWYNGYTRGKVVTRVESNLPLLANENFGGTRCQREDSPDIYQLYWRLFIRKKPSTLE